MSEVTQAHREECVALANSIKAVVIVEIGVKYGRQSRFFAKSVKTIQSLYLIDPWKGCDGDEYNLAIPHAEMRAYAKRVKKWAVERSSKTKIIIGVMKMKSSDAVSRFPDGFVDFLYIDGDHSPIGVETDITMWCKKVRKGGIIAGDDYPIVRDTVDKLLPHRKISQSGKLWWVNG